MGEDPKSIWKKSFTGRTALVVWLAIAAFLVSLLAVMILDHQQWRADWGIVFAGTIGGVVVALFFLFIRWLFCRRNWKRPLFGLACFAALVALFYAEEDWRGWHAWNKFKREWEAKGEKFDWQSVVPPRVPDDQNFAMAPIFNTTDTLLDWKWLKQHRNPNFHPSVGLSNLSEENENPLDTNIVNQLDMNIYHTVHIYDEDGGYSPETDATIGNWAKGTVTDLKPWQAYYRSPIKTNWNSSIMTNEFPVSPQPQSPAADVLLALGRYDSAIEELRLASQRPYSRFPLSYDQGNGFEIAAAHWESLKNCSQVLQLRSLAELQNGQDEKAFADLKLSLYLVNSIRTEPFMISHLVRAAMWQMSLQPIYEGLAEHKWSDTQLAELGSELAKFDFLADCKLAVRGEMGIRGGFAEYASRHPEIFSFEDDIQDVSFWRRTIWRLIPEGWFYQNQMNCARTTVEYYLPVVDANAHTVSPELLRRAQAVLADHEKHWTLFNFLEEMLLPADGAFEGRLAYRQSSVDLARVAVALERYHLAHGEYPETLAALAPQFIEKIPHDVIGGQPLHYRRTDDGQFVLYSVGWNETDDGGVVSFSESGSVDPDKGDWVWRYPAK